MNEPGYYNQFGTARIVLIVGFFVVAYMLYNLTISIYDNYQIEKHITDTETKNKELTEENKKKLEDFQYYTSPEYTEKVAKQNLGMINQGEEVIIIPNGDLVVMSDQENAAQISEEMRAAWPNPKKWLKFFFSYNPFKV